MSEVTVSGDGFNPLWILLALALMCGAFYVMVNQKGSFCEWTACPNLAVYTVVHPRTNESLRVCATHRQIALGAGWK